MPRGVYARASKRVKRFYKRGRKLPGNANPLPAQVVSRLLCEVAISELPQLIGCSAVVIYSK